MAFRPDRSDKTLKYEVRDLASLLTMVIPHFEEYPLMSSKRRDFEKFATVGRLLDRRRHLTREGSAGGIIISQSEADAMEARTAAVRAKVESMFAKYRKPATQNDRLVEQGAEPAEKPLSRQWSSRPRHRWSTIRAMS